MVVSKSVSRSRLRSSTRGYIVKTIICAAFSLSLSPLVSASSCWNTAEQETGIDRYLLAAVSQVESGIRPHALAVANKGVWLSKQPNSISQALSWATWLNQRGYIFAIGATQINWRAHGKRLEAQGVTMQKLYCDPCLQISSGAKILKDCFDSEGVNWSGVGCYYTGPGRNRLPWERYKYSKKVYENYIKLKNTRSDLTVPQVTDPACGQT